MSLLRPADSPWRHLRLAWVLLPLLLPGARGTVTPPLPAPTPAKLRYVILRCDALDGPGGPLSDTTLRRRYDGPAPSVADWYAEMSEGQFTFEIAGMQHVALPGTVATYRPLQTGLLAQFYQDCARGAVGLDWNNIQGILFHPNFTGAGNLGGSKVINLPSGSRLFGFSLLEPSGADLFAMIHEVGHSIGWPHSGADYPGDGLEHDYDSPWDVMSGLLSSQTIAVNRNFSGWIPAERRARLLPGTSQDFDLEIVGSGRQGPRLPGSLDMLELGSPNDALQWTAEARLARGQYDQGLPASGVILHRLPSELGCCRAKLIDTDGDGDPFDDGTYLVPGERYEVAAGLGIEVLAATTNGYRIRAWSGWTLSVVVRGNGTVSGVPGNAPCINTTCRSLHAVVGQTATLTATAGPSASFRGWRGACTGTGTCTLPLDKTGEVVAHFGSEPLLLSDHVRPYAAVGRPYQDTLRADVVGGGAATISATGLPAGLTISTSTGQISGTPLVAGTTSPVITLSASGVTTVDTITIAVLANVPAIADSIFLVRNRPVWMALPPGGTGAIGRGAHVVSGTLPSGMGFRADGALGGVPTGVAETRNVTIGYTLPTGAASTAYHFVVLDRAPTITTPPLAGDYVIGTDLSVALTVQANDPVVWSIVGGSLPPGVALTQNRLQGRLLSQGTYAFGVEARRGTVADTLAASFEVLLPSLTESDVITRYLRRIPFTPAAAVYLDNVGNRDGRVDLGDIRNWLKQQGHIRGGNP